MYWLGEVDDVQLWYAQAKIRSVNIIITVSEKTIILCRVLLQLEVANEFIYLSASFKIV